MVQGGGSPPIPDKPMGRGGRVAAMAVIVGVAAFIAAFLFWADRAMLDEVVRAQARVIPASKVQVVQSTQDAVLEALYIDVGDTVKAGQVLMKLSNSFASADLQANRVRLDALDAAIVRLEAEIAEKKPVFPEDLWQHARDAVAAEMDNWQSRRARYQTQAEILRQQLFQRRRALSEWQANLQGIDRDLALARQERALLAPLVEKGVAPKIDLIRIDRQIVEKETIRASLLAGRPRLQSAEEEARRRLEEHAQTFIAEATEMLGKMRIERRTIAERLRAQQSRVRQTEVVAPVHGIVKSIGLYTLGGVAAAGQTLAEIVPLDGKLLVEARLQPRDVAFIHPGQKGIMKLSAYDYTIYGGLLAEVIDISADTLVDENGLAYYQVRLRLQDPVLSNAGNRIRAIPGMTGQIDILTGRRSVLQYLLKPFLRARAEALRER